MKRIDDYLNVFKAQGGIFCIPINELIRKSHQVQGFIFDWDGVFHSGKKGENKSGVFSESDSMGINMLRYGYWRLHCQVPYMAIISGEKDRTAFTFAEREHFNAVYTRIPDKKIALEHTCINFQTEPKQMVCFFDDINDLTMAKHCGLRMQIRRHASPLFMEYTLKKGLCDYLTAQDSSTHAIRECCEFLLGLWGIYSETIESRVVFDQYYQEYWEARNKIQTEYFSWDNNEIVVAMSKKKGNQPLINS